MTTETMGEQYLADYIEKVKAERGILAARQAKYFLKDVPADLSPRNLDAYRTRLKAESRLEASSINRKLGAVRSYLKWLAATERVDLSKDAIRDNLGFYRADRRKVSLPDPGSIRRLMGLVLDRPGRQGTAYARFVCIGLFAGLRPGEIEHLTAASVVPRQQYLHIERTKTGIERHAYYAHSAVLLKTMQHLRLLHEDGGRLVQSGAASWFPAACEQAGMGRQSRNVLRKLCASYMASSGKFSEWYLMQTLGHTTPVSIGHYRDPSVIAAIKPGVDIESWMGLADLIEPLSAKMVG